MGRAPGTAAGSEQYTWGHDEFVVEKLFGTRRAAEHAAFLLPRLKPGMRVLDVGCGPGTITMDLARAVAPGEVIGVDIAESDIQKARGAADAAAIRNVRFEVGDVYSYFENADRFDAIYSNGMLEHLSDPPGVLAKALPALVPGGLIGVRTGDYGGFLIAPADPVLEAAMSLLYRVWQHNGGNPFIGRNLKSLLHTAGFTAIEGVASYQSHGTAPAVAWFADAMVNALSGPKFVKQVLDLGWAEQSHFERVRDAIGRWRNNPASFAAVSWCAAIGVRQ